MSAAIAVMTALWAAQEFGLMDKRVNDSLLWFALIGSALTVAVGSVSSRIRTKAKEVRNSAEAK